MHVPCHLGFKDLISSLQPLALSSLTYYTIRHHPRRVRSMISESPFYVRVWITSLMKLRRVQSMLSNSAD